MTNSNLGTLSGARLQEIGHRLEEETLRCQNLQVALGRTTNELARLKSLEPRFGSNDDVIVSKWKTIRSFIRQFAHNYSRDLMYSKGFFNYGHQNHGFRSLTPNFDRYVRTHERRSRLFQAFIWRWLLLNIFRNPTIIFGEGHATVFNALLNTFTAASKKLTEKEYANWRAYTSTMISKSCGISDSGIEKLALALEEQLLALLPTKYYRENARVGLLGSVREVVSQATELAEVFLYSIPQGSSFGENYDQAVILIKAEVLT
ncbi:hypothetical protein MGN70_001173 [Eutypa lata]|nr:hypothetical protein MGN70_001173 [Eutypa lata]